VRGAQWARLLSLFTPLLCPKLDMALWPPTCDVSSLFGGVFESRSYQLPLGLSINVMPAQMHMLVLATFTSLIAPFGGFFASGVKRAFRVKDFGDVIPGHGGVTDRMDCQFLNSTFACLYLKTFVWMRGPLVIALVARVLQLESGQLAEFVAELLKQSAFVREIVQQQLAALA
jgi:phosphatidate cytidylyltransferase